jgi:hypothetical protein
VLYKDTMSYYGCLQFLIVGITFTIGVLDEDDLSVRLPNLYTMLLVAVAFKLAVTSKLPLISYMTMTDLYAGKQCLRAHSSRPRSGTF